MLVGPSAPPSDLLAWRAAATPRRLAVLAPRVAWDYAALHAQAHAWAHWLRERGLQAGHRVAVAARPTPQALALWHGLMRVGLTPVMLHLRFAPHEHARVLDAVQPQAVLVTPEAAAGLQLPPEVRAWTLPPAPPTPPSTPEPPTEAGVEVLLLTSGTTQAPKIARLTPANFFWSALAAGYRLGLSPRDRWLLTLPLYHVGGLSIVVRSVLYGITVVIPPARPSFDPQALWHALHRWQPTLVSVVPTMLYRLLRSAPQAPAPRALRVLLVGGAAAGADLLREARARGLPVALTYGLTEATSQVATAEPATVWAKPGSVGRGLLFTQVSVRDPEGRALPSGQVGEIWVRGPGVFRGYWRAPAATRRALSPKGWLRTGDAGYVDRDGDLWVLARRDDLIVTGGENVTPHEVEAVLRQHPAVADAAVVGIADPEWGQRVAAAVVLRPQRRASAAELQAFCRQHLAGYKVPRRWRFVGRLPRTASGKVRRAVVRAWF